VLVVEPEQSGGLFERDQAGSGKNSDLTHSATEELAKADRLADQLTPADDQRADRCAKPLREAEHDRVEWRGNLCHRHSERCRGIEDPRTIEVDGNAECVSAVADFTDHLNRHQCAASHVVRILEGDQRGWCDIVWCAVMNCRTDIVPGKDAVFAANWPEGDSGKDRRRPHLIIIDMASLLKDHLAARS